MQDARRAADRSPPLVGSGSPTSGRRGPGDPAHLPMATQIRLTVHPDTPLRARARNTSSTSSWVRRSARRRRPAPAPGPSRYGRGSTVDPLLRARMAALGLESAEGPTSMRVVARQQPRRSVHQGTCGRRLPSRDALMAAATQASRQRATRPQCGPWPAIADGPRPAFVLPERDAVDAGVMRARPPTSGQSRLSGVVHVVTNEACSCTRTKASPASSSLSADVSLTSLQSTRKGFVVIDLKVSRGCVACLRPRYRPAAEVHRVDPCAPGRSWSRRAWHEHRTGDLRSAARLFKHLRGRTL